MPCFLYKELPLSELFLRMLERKHSGHACLPVSQQWVEEHLRRPGSWERLDWAATPKPCITTTGQGSQERFLVRGLMVPFGIQSQREVCPPAGPKEPVQLPGTLPGLFLSGALPSFEWRAPPLHHRTSEGSFKSMSHLAWALSPLGLGDCSIPILLTSAVVH